jgi:putative SbcD/Mre11-related phosphoesterase
MKQPKGREIAPGIEIYGLTLYLRAEKALVLCDLHLGFEEELNALGLMVPKFQYKEIVAHLSAVFDLPGVKPERILINGDLKHEFGRISTQEWKEVLSFLDFLQTHCNETILIKGNHDAILGPIAGKKNLRIADHYFFEKSRIYVAHGHKVPKDGEFRRAGTVIIGHDHPAITLSDGVRTEKVKCFIKGSWNKKTLIQMPSLSFVTEGSDLVKDESLSPFMKRSRGEHEAYCVEGLETFYFGKIKNL